MKRNWKTSLFGFMAAAGSGMAAVDDPTVKAIGIGLSIFGSAMLGLAAKDSNVTGGTVQQ